jgi:hypothetical protein
VEGDVVDDSLFVAVNNCMEFKIISEVENCAALLLEEEGEEEEEAREEVKLVVEEGRMGGLG